MQGKALLGGNVPIMSCCVCKENFEVHFLFFIIILSEKWNKCIVLECIGNMCKIRTFCSKKNEWTCIYDNA